MVKLTKSQKAYLQSADVNPTGRTVVGFKVRDKLVTLGLMIDTGFGMAKITDLGYAALNEEVRK